MSKTKEFYHDDICNGLSLKKLEMNKLFVPYNISLKLNKLGFDEECLAIFDDEELSILDIRFLDDGIFSVRSSNYDDPRVIAAPLWQQVIDWLRNDFQISVKIDDFLDDENRIEWDYEIVKVGTDLDEFGNYIPLIPYSMNDPERKFKSYELARESGIIKSLELIEKKQENEKNIKL